MGRNKICWEEFNHLKNNWDSCVIRFGDRDILSSELVFWTYWYYCCRAWYTTHSATNTSCRVQRSCLQGVSLQGHCCPWHKDIDAAVSATNTSTIIFFCCSFYLFLYFYYKISVPYREDYVMDMRGKVHRNQWTFMHLMPNFNKTPTQLKLYHLLGFIIWIM